MAEQETRHSTVVESPLLEKGVSCETSLLLLARSMESKVIERVFVARRPLKGTGKLMKGVAAHSGLLLRTTDQGYYILEYLADSKAELYEIHLNVIESIEDPPHEIFLLGDFKWTKQMYGKPITDPKWTLGKVLQ